MKPVRSSLLESTTYTIPGPDDVAFGRRSKRRSFIYESGKGTLGGKVYVLEMELLLRLIATSLGPPGAAYGIGSMIDSFTLGRPVSRTKSVSSGVI